MSRPLHRRAAVLLLAGSLIASACGSDTEPASEAQPLDSLTETSGTDADESEVAEAADATDPEATSTSTEPDTDEASTPAGKPDVEIPAELPTDLVITDLIEGSGDAAADGDSVELNTVAVLSEDGTEVIDTYSMGSVTLIAGAGSGFTGLDQGLIGVKAGGRRQLDMPPALALGATGDGATIPPNAALTFVIDVLSVTPPPPPPTLAPQADAADCPAPDGSSEKQQEFAEYPPTCIDVTKTYTATVVSNFGELTIELDPAKAPITVNSFVTLARYHYFDGTECHRAMPGFVVQCGDPTASGSGGPGYRFPDELPESGEYELGSLAMANSGPDTNGSQFFIITGASGAALPPSYSLFGQVTDGLTTTVAAMDAVANPDPASNGVPPLEQILIESITITES